MSDINFTIRKVFPGSVAQKNVGILASFNMTIDGPDGIIASINDMKLRQTKEGKHYIESSYRTFEGTDENGQKKEQKVYSIKFFPEQKNWPKQDVIVQQVIRALEETSKGAPAKQPSAAKPAVKASAPADQSSPW